MKTTHSRLILGLTGVILFGISMSFAPAADAVRAVTYSPHAAAFDCHMNMGPTGAKAWMYGYHFVVMSIDQGSPAADRLMLGDVVIAADGTAFGPDADARITLGNAIGKAEATGRPLKLTVRRDGRKRKVALDLPALGAFSATWPGDCDKSKRILDAACRSLLNAQLPDGSLRSDGEMGTFLTGLLLLASGDPLYMDGARRAAYRAATMDYAKLDYTNWPMGYGGVLLAEYYLATGDDTVLPKLREIAGVLARGQMRCGSWGHNGPAAGYGAMNQAGIICALALALAAECGIDVDQEALNKAVLFFGRYAELGCVPYGDNMPGQALDDNGHNASSALLMHLVGRDTEAEAFSRSVALSYWMRETGHTGGFFSMVWGPLGASLAGDQALQTFMDYQRWYYNLCRTWKGELVLLPYREALTRFDSSSYIYFGGDFTTGGLGLALALPQKQLRILGAPTSVFSPRAALTGGLLTARKYYLVRDWPACDQALAAIAPDSLTTPEEQRWLAQLDAARTRLKRSTERTLQEVESNLVEGAAYRASEQYQALKRCLGDRGDARFAKLDERLADGTVVWYIREGLQYHEAWAGLYGYAVRSWVPQGWQAKRLIEGLPTLRQPIWEPLSPTSQITPQPWRTLASGEALPKGWERLSFDDSAWHAADGIVVTTDANAGNPASPRVIAARRRFTVADPAGAKLRVRLQAVREAHSQVYLNGQRIVDVVRGQRGGYAAIELDDAALTLLKSGENVLAITSTKQGSGGNSLDVGLEINRVALEKRTLPVMRATTTYLDLGTGGDGTLRVQETKDRMQAALTASYTGKTIDELLAELADPVAYSRHLAEDALVGKGLEGLSRAVALIDHPDWKVRSAVCNVVSKGWRTYHGNAQGPEMKLLNAQIPALIGMLGDDHFWVRVRAAATLPSFGTAAQSAVPALLRLVNESNEWVRISALGAVRSLNKDPDTAIQAALQSLMIPSTAYRAPRSAVSLLTDFPEAGQGRLDALINLLRHPPEGDGRRLLNDVIDMAVKLDPEGTSMIPVLIGAAADETHFSRQRGNPRAAAIEALGAYGDKAKAAIPCLEAILASDGKQATSQHEAAQKALTAITGKDPGNHE